MPTAKLYMKMFLREFSTRSDQNLRKKIFSIEKLESFCQKTRFLVHFHWKSGVLFSQILKCHTIQVIYQTNTGWRPIQTIYLVFLLLFILSSFWRWTYHFVQLKIGIFQKKCHNYNESSKFLKILFAQSFLHFFEHFYQKNFFPPLHFIGKPEKNWVDVSFCPTVY